MAEKNLKDLDDIRKGIGDVSMPPEVNIPSPDIPSPEIPEESYSPEPQAPYIPPIGEPSMPQQMAPQMDISEKIHEVAEAIIDERWSDFTSKVGNLSVWQEKVNMNISSIKQEVVRIQERFENLQKAVVGKVSEYDQGIRSIHTEMKALEKVFERILEPLVNNVKELNKITEELKKIKK